MTNGLANIAVNYGDDSGQTINIEFNTNTGQRLGLTFDKKNLADLITGLTEIALSAARLRTAGIPVPIDYRKEQIPLRAIDASHVGVVWGADKSFHMIFRLLDFDLNFRIQPKHLRPIANGLLQAARDVERQSKPRAH